MVQRGIGESYHEENEYEEEREDWQEVDRKVLSDPQLLLIPSDLVRLRLLGMKRVFIKRFDI